jgi:hypothetical protein
MSVKFKIGICAGVAVGVDGDMYVISWQTQEMVKMTRDGQTELARVNLARARPEPPRRHQPDRGQRELRGPELAKQQAAILSPKGTIVVAAGQGRQMTCPPLKGGNDHQLGRDPDGLRQRARVVMR